jgi:hypothetical protein
MARIFPRGNVLRGFLWYHHVEYNTICTVSKRYAGPLLLSSYCTVRLLANQARTMCDTTGQFFCSLRPPPTRKLRTTEAKMMFIIPTNGVAQCATLVGEVIDEVLRAFGSFQGRSRTKK